jgi:hypothetical protein
MARFQPLLLHLKLIQTIPLNRSLGVGLCGRASALNPLRRSKAARRKALHPPVNLPVTDASFFNPSMSPADF